MVVDLVDFSMLTKTSCSFTLYQTPPSATAAPFGNVSNKATLWDRIAVLALVKSIAAPARVGRARPPCVKDDYFRRKSHPYRSIV